MSGFAPTPRNAPDLCPAEIKFVLEDEDSHCQPLTLYNPRKLYYRFNVYTASSKFGIEEKRIPILQPRSTEQVNIRCLNPSVEDLDTKHLLVIELCETYTRKIMNRNYCIASIVSRDDNLVKQNPKPTEENNRCSGYESPEEITMGKPQHQEVHPQNEGYDENEESEEVVQKSVRQSEPKSNQNITDDERVKILKNVEETRDHQELPPGDGNPGPKKTSRAVAWKMNLFLWAIMMMLLEITYLLKHQLEQEMDIPKWVISNVAWKVRLAALVGFLSVFSLGHTLSTVKILLTNLFS